MKTGTRRSSPEKRFNAKFIRKGKDDCWPWIGSQKQNGYGSFYDGTQVVYAHRFAFTLSGREVPHGICVCHKCDNRLCVNPTHLFTGTVQDNTDDKVSKKRHLHGITHPLAKLTERDVENIKKLIAKGRTQNDIANIFGITQQQISRINTGKRWKHLHASMKNKNQIQQGDVLFRVVPSLPKGCKRLNTRTVALGEATGHHHTFADGVALMEAPDKTMFAVNESDEPRTLTHQEHKPVTLQPGEIAEFGQVREKDWFTEMVRTVRD